MANDVVAVDRDEDESGRVSEQVGAPLCTESAGPLRVSQPVTHRAVLGEERRIGLHEAVQVATTCRSDRGLSHAAKASGSARAIGGLVRSHITSRLTVQQDERVEESRPVVVAATWLHYSGDAVLAVRPRGLDVFFLPGGVPEPGETYAEAAAREVMEEVGLQLKATELREVVRLDDDAFGRDDVTVRIICFEGPAVGTPMPDGDEIEELAWLPPSQWHRFAPPVQRALESARERLERLHARSNFAGQLDKSLASTAGVAEGKDYPEFSHQASINEWVRAQRRSGEAL